MRSSVSTEPPEHYIILNGPHTVGLPHGANISQVDNYRIHLSQIEGLR